MEHWLDTFAKRLASRPLSRRGFLAGAVRTGVAAAGATVLGLGGPSGTTLAENGRAAGALANQNHDKDVTCSITPTGNTRVLQATVAARGGRLVLDETITASLPPLNQGPRTVQTDLTITLDGTLLFRKTLTSSSTGSAPNKYAVTSVSETIQYGEGFSGVQDASFTSDGTTVQGTVNGRAIVPFPASATEGRLTYVGGQPVPALRGRPDIEQAIRQILVKAQTDAPECFAAIDPQLCDQCQDNCFTTFPGGLLECAGVSALTCAFTFGLGCVVGAISCIGVWENCENTCFNPGGACCSVTCANGSCCPEGYVCALTPPNVPNIDPYLPTCCETGVDSFCANTCPFEDPNCGGICCPQGFGTCCGGLCCGSAGVCCKNGCCGHACTTTDGLCCDEVNGQPVTSCKGKCCADPADVCTIDGVCCPPLKGGPNPPLSCNGQCCTGANDICVGSGCCPAGAPVCADGSCCDGGTCVNGTCCASPSKACGGTCCGPFNPCCGTDCCANASDVCINGACCAASQACGSTCCPSGQICTDATSGTCGACGTGKTSTVCENFTSPPTTTCCATGDICCGGNCCPSSDTNGPIECCNPTSMDIFPYNTMTFGCHHATACTVIVN